MLNLAYEYLQLRQELVLNYGNKPLLTPGNKAIALILLTRSFRSFTLRLQLVILSVAFTPGCSNNPEVFLCNGPYSKVYHKTSDCRGLAKCSTSIESIEVSTAVKRNRRECRYCYH
jgi:hypothetical protein